MLDLRSTLGLRAVAPPGAAREQALSGFLPWLCFARKDVILLRDGDVMGSFLVEGLDPLTAEHAAISDLSEAMSRCAAELPPDAALYIHRLSHPETPEVPAVSADGFAAELDAAWRAHLRSLGLRRRRVMVSVLLRPAKAAGLRTRLTGGGVPAQRAALAKRIARLDEIMGHMQAVLAVAGPRRLTRESPEWLGMLGATVSGAWRPRVHPLGLATIADSLATSDLHFRGDGFTLPGLDAAETRFGAMVTLKAYPAQTTPCALAGLDLPEDTLLSQSYTPINPYDALARIQRTLRQMRAADDAARSLALQLEEAADDLASGRAGFGLHHLSIMATAESPARLDEIATQIRGAVQAAGAGAVRESIGARAAYFAQASGNYGFRARAAMISSGNFADLAALHAPCPGSSADASPWGAPVAVLPTLSHEAYRFGFHLPGAPGDRTVGHALVIGRTGSGKSASMAFLMAQMQRLSPRILVFDKDRGLESPVRAMGGSYAAIRMGAPTGFNPFATETDAHGCAWLADWLEALLSRDDGPLSAQQREALTQTVEANAHTAPALQTADHFRAALRGIDDGGDLFTRMGRWAPGGQHGWLFAGEGEDALDLARDISGVDLTEIFDAPAIRTAWLSYAFRLVERMVEDGRPTLILLDEAWKLLDDGYFEARLKDWMLTMRKKNVALVMLTQRVSHVAESRAGGSILESIATTLVFPSSRFTAAELAPLGLSDAETAFLTRSPGGRRFAAIRTGDHGALVDLDLAALGPLLAVLGGGPSREGDA